MEKYEVYKNTHLTSQMGLLFSPKWLLGNHWDSNCLEFLNPGSPEAGQKLAMPYVCLQAMSKYTQLHRSNSKQLLESGQFCFLQ